MHACISLQLWLLTNYGWFGGPQSKQKTFNSLFQGESLSNVLNTQVVNCSVRNAITQELVVCIFYIYRWGDNAGGADIF